MTIGIGVPIQEYLGKNIKELITEFPQIADVLNRYDIGCVTCGLGTCLFKDIIYIHDLNPEIELELMGDIAGIIAPGEEIVWPKIERKSKPPAGSAAYSPPMKELMEEHRLIKRLLALIPDIIKNLDLTTESGRDVISQSVDFIRFYADKFHHAKEEAILFEYFDGNLDIIKTICADHETGRGRVKAIMTGLEKQDREAVALNLKAYQELLIEHIKKEDEILYRWMDRNLSIKQVGEMFARFKEKDAEFGDSPLRYRELITQFETNNIIKRSN